MNHIAFLRYAPSPPLIGDAGGSEILAVSKQGYVVILRRRTGKARRRRNCKMKVERDVLICFYYEDTKRKFSNGTLNAQTNPLIKLRFTPQVSAAFASVSILIHADSIDPDFCVRGML
jgi:hypothetical protein